MRNANVFSWWYGEIGGVCIVRLIEWLSRLGLWNSYGGWVI